MTVQTTAQQRRNYAPPCSSGRGVTLSLNGTGRVYVDRRATDAVKALNACLVAWKYETRRADTGAYACRAITGGTNYSLHAYLIALDLNWLSNPYQTPAQIARYGLRTDMPTAMVGAILAIRTNNGAQVWGSGMFYRVNKDPMHFELVCTPADLATGIDWRTVPGATTKVPYSWVPTERLEPGSHVAAVARLQLALELLRPFTKGPHLDITSPPGYGPKTTESVRAFQSFARSMQRLAGEKDLNKLIQVDGIWGPITAKAAKFWLPSASAQAKAAA